MLKKAPIWRVPVLLAGRTQNTLALHSDIFYRGARQTQLLTPWSSSCNAGANPGRNFPGILNGVASDTTELSNNAMQYTIGIV